MLNNYSCWTQGWGPQGPKAYNPIEPTPDMVDIEMIAHVLSQQCRFAGHTNKFYSVAQHCVLVSEHCNVHQSWGLLHDASEALIVDVPRPLKRQAGFSYYMECEKEVMRVVCERYNLQLEMPEEVRAADDLLLALEFRDLMYYPMREIIADSIHDLDLRMEDRIQPWSSITAEREFLRAAQQLGLTT